MTQQTETPAAQASPMETKPQAQHRWLHKLVGEWQYEFEAMTPGGPTSSGTERVRKIGDLWVVAESDGEMPGSGPIVMVVTLGYDPAKKRFVGTWIGSMMADLWVYDGELDAAERVLTLNSIGPSMKGDGSRAPYQDIIELVNDNERLFRAQVLEDGAWKPLMTARYRRTR